MTGRDFDRVADRLAEKRRRQDEAQLIETARGGMWPEAHRAMPNDFARCELFAAVNLRRKERRMLRDVVLASQSGMKVSIVSGEELDQSDLDVFLGLLHVTREQLLKDECTVRVGTFLKKIIGKTDTTANRRLLHESLERLRAMSLKIQLSSKGGYVGGLLSGFDYLGAGQGPTPFVAYRVFLDPRIASLFGAGQFSLVHWEIRKSLRGKPIAQWLHCFYSSHIESEHSYSLDRLAAIAGLTTKSATKRRQNMRRALQVLQEAARAQGVPMEYSIDEDRRVRIRGLRLDADPVKLIRLPNSIP